MRGSDSNVAIYEYNTKKDVISRGIMDLQETLLNILSDTNNCRFTLNYPGSLQCDESREPKLRSSSRSKTREKDPTGLSVLQILTSPTNNSSSRYEQCNWISSLDETSASKLLIGKLNESLDFLARLHCRVSDSHSRVLITGDVNSGKSSLINALIQKEVLPIDQQPCTQAFAEITLGPESYSDCSVHGVSDICEYDAKQTSSFKLLSLEEFGKFIQEDPSPYPWFKLYLSEHVPDCKYAKLLAETSLIDSPGLNSDSYKTMALFAQQEDIDVVIFVLNAANHITLSARDFLEAAGLDKADNIFIIVNKYDEINNKDKCKRIIMQQIDEIFPSIDKKSFVFFTSARQSLSNNPILISDMSLVDSFKLFESHLVEFLLSKKSRSKLKPAVNYINSLVKELLILIGHNINQAVSEAEKTEEEIKILTPAYEDLLRQETELLLKLEEDSTRCCNHIYNYVKTSLDGFRIGIPDFLKQQKWLGLLRIWSYRSDVIQAAQRKCIYEFDLCKRYALQKTHDTSKSMTEYTNIAKYVKLDSTQLTVEMNMPIIILQRWDLINFKYELNRYKTVLGASSAIAAIIGYQPALNVTMKIGELLTRVHYSKYAVFGAAIVTLFLGFKYVDFEGMIRRRLEASLLDAYGEDFTHENARKVENDCHGMLSATQSQIMHNFYECVTRQRKLKAEKDVYKAQMRARFEHFALINQRLEALRTKLESLEL